MVADVAGWRAWGGLSRSRGVGVARTAMFKRSMKKGVLSMAWAVVKE